MTPQEIDPELIRSAKTLYLEGYTFDRPQAKEAFYEAAATARAAGGRSRSPCRTRSASTGTGRIS